MLSLKDRVLKFEEASRRQPTKESPPVMTKVEAVHEDAACGLDVQPKYEKLIDKLADIEGEIKDNLYIKTMELTKHNQLRKQQEEHYRGLMGTCVEQIATYTVQLTQATAQKLAKQAAGVVQEGVRHELCAEMREKYAECHEQVKSLEEELCGIFIVRQQVYQTLQKGSDIDIEDCLMGPWIAGECSNSCFDETTGAGTQPMTRKILAENNIYGAVCPPDKLTR